VDSIKEKRRIVSSLKRSSRNGIDDGCGGRSSRFLLFAHIGAAIINSKATERGSSEIGSVRRGDGSGRLHDVSIMSEVTEPCYSRFLGRGEMNRSSMCMVRWSWQESMNSFSAVIRATRSPARGRSPPFRENLERETAGFTISLDCRIGPDRLLAVCCPPSVGIEHSGRSF
jgi:hypothetical protein